MKPSELLATPGHWTQGCYARDQLGAETDLRGAAAMKWCLIGAIFKCLPSNADTDASHAAMQRAVKDALPRRGENRTLVAFNDDPRTTHAQVLAVLKKAGL